MAAETAGTNSRLNALAAAAVELQQPVQQSPSITSYMEALQAASGMQPARNRSCEVPAADQSKLIFQQTVRAPTFTELVVQASSCVEEIRHDLQHDVAIIPPKHALKRYKVSSCAEKLLNHQTITPALREADQAHPIPCKRSGKAVYRKKWQQLQTDHEEPNLELRLGNGHLHNVDVHRRTFLHSRAKQLQLQRAAAAAAHPISCHIPVEGQQGSPNKFQYRVESRAGMLQHFPSAFSRPAAAAPPPIIGSTITMLPVSTTAASQEDLRLAQPLSGAAQLEALKDDARAAALRSYRRQWMTRSASSSAEMPIVLPLVPCTTITATTESYKGPPHQNCGAATTAFRNAMIIGHPRSALMGTMGPHPQMMLSAMGPPPVPAIMGSTASLPSSVISTAFPLGRPLASLPGDLSLCKYSYVPFLLLVLLQLFMDHQTPTAAPGLCTPHPPFHARSIDSGRDVCGHEFVYLRRICEFPGFSIAQFGRFGIIHHILSITCMHAVHPELCKIYIRYHEYRFQLCILITTQQFA
jgi:hypothetical protein